MPTSNNPSPLPLRSPQLFPQQFRWYLPSCHGDICLEKTGAMETQIRVFELTDMEEKALDILRKRAVKVPFSGKPWADEEEFLPASSATYRTKFGLVITLRAPIEEVEKIIRRDEEPPKDEKNEEVEGENIPDYAKDKANKERKEKEAKAAATVKKPQVGCPMPEFPEADIRASRVLEVFLNDAQIADYRKYGAFMTIGRDTGHRYIVANRETPQA